MSEMLTWNVNEGFSEAVLRSLRMSFLKEEDYIALKNTNNMVDFKMALETTDYEELLVNQSSDIDIPKLKGILKQKLAQEINYIQTNTCEPLTEFLDLMRHGYWIDNIVNIIEGVKSKVDLDLLFKRNDPLGEFPEMKHVKVVEGEDYTDLYQTVLIDIPVGKYFHTFLEGLLAGDANRDASSIQNIMKEYKAEKIKNLLKKIWLTEFSKFCNLQLDGASKEIMNNLLKFESDCMTIQIIYNSIGNKELGGSAKGREAERKQYIHLEGFLYPGRDIELTQADDLNKLREAVRPFDIYRKMLENAPDPGKEEDFSNAPKTLDDIMFEEKAKQYALAFEQQFHVASYYAYLRLKEQEIRNIVWLAELVKLNIPKTQPGWKKIIVPFKDIY